MDSSEEEFGLVGVAGSGFGGDVEMEERSRVDAEDRRDSGLEGEFCGGLQGSYCRGGGSHIDMSLRSIIDKRCMNKSLTERLCPVVTLQSCSFMLCENIVIPLCMSAEPVVTQTHSGHAAQCF